MIAGYSTDEGVHDLGFLKFGCESVFVTDGYFRASTLSMIETPRSFAATPEFTAAIVRKIEMSALDRVLAPGRPVRRLQRRVARA